MRFLASAFKNPLIQMLLVIACSFVVALGALRVPPVLSFAIVLLVLFIVLFVKNPRQGIFLLIVIKPIIDTTWQYRFQGLRMNLLYVVGGLFPVLALFTIIKERVKVSGVPLVSLWLLFLVSNLLSAIFIVTNQGAMQGVNFFARVLNGFAAFILMPYLFKGEDGKKLFLTAFILSAIFPLAIAVMQIGGGVELRTQITTGALERIAGFYHDPVNLRFYAVQALGSILVFMALFKNHSLLIKSLFVAMIFACILTVYRCYTKAGWLILAVWLLLWNLLRGKKLQTAGVVFSLVTIFTLSVAFSNSFQRLFHKEIAFVQGAGPKEVIFQGRMNIWESGYDLFKHSSLQNIIFGMGKYSFYTISAHNDILRVLFANGIIGLIVYLALLGKAGFLVVKRFVRGRSPFALLGVLTFIALIIDSIGTMPTMYPGYQWFAWGVLGLALAPDAEATPADQHHEQKN